MNLPPGRVADGVASSAGGALRGDLCRGSLEFLQVVAGNVEVDCRDNLFEAPKFDQDAD